MATDKEVTAAGYSLPSDTDLMTGGDDAIRANARAAYDQRLWRGTLLADTDLDTLDSGWYRVTSVLVARSLGLPGERPGVFHNANVLASGATTQSFQTLEAPGAGTREFKRDQILNTWSPWRELVWRDEQSSNSSGGGLGHDLYRQGIQARKGGRIGTAGRGVVALRFDDAPAEFVAKVLPLLEARNLPFTRVTTSESVHGEALPEGTFDAMQDYSIQSGGEVWNHGRTHGESSGTALDAEISGALDTLKTAMPRIPIDCFAPPGGSISWGGYMPSNSVENYTTTVAGQMIMNLHGLVTGYFTDSYYWPLDGIMRDGQMHYSVDAYTGTRGKELIDRARDWRVGIVMMWHSNNLDTGGNMTTAELEEVLDHLAQERDSGNVLALTVSGLATADESSDYRRDPLNTHSGADWSESFPYQQFRRALLGSTRELTATVTGDAGATITSTLSESTRSHTVPSSGTLELRHVATIPSDVTSLSVSITGGTTQNAHLHAV